MISSCWPFSWSSVVKDSTGSPRTAETKEEEREEEGEEEEEEEEEDEDDEMDAFAIAEVILGSSSSLSSSFANMGHSGRSVVNLCFFLHSLFLVWGLWACPGLDLRTVGGCRYDEEEWNRGAVYRNYKSV